jgi:uncharacterized RDD family membrane protein YckC
VRSTPPRGAYPVAATALAHAYERTPAEEAESQPCNEADQQMLFSTPINDGRVISFDTLTSPAEREAIRARAAEASRPAPVRHAKVELRRAKTKRNQRNDQRSLEFSGNEEIVNAPPCGIICDAPVAPTGLRVEAALIDGAMIALGCVFVIACYRFAGGPILPGKHELPFLLMGLATVPILYKILWTWAGRDSIGTGLAGLALVDFDGNPPSRQRRYYRVGGAFLSLLAAGIGLVWSIVDEENLTWHDHISGTFPTVVEK